MGRFWRPSLALLLLAALAVSGTRPAVAAQGTGSVRGTVTRAADGAPLPDVTVSIKGTGIRAVTDRDGRFVLRNVPVGPQVVFIVWLGFRPYEVGADVRASGVDSLDARIEARPIILGDILIEAASRAPERVVDAPAAVSVVDPAVARDLSITGQTPKALAALPGVDVIQNGVNDFNVSARGFHASLTRRVLVLQDGRDLSFPLLGAQEWNALSFPLEDMARIEMMRGPGSALYGANAYSGVLNFSTPAAREVVGTKLTVSGGGLGTVHADLRQAGLLGGGRLGYRVNLGYYRSDSWSRSRTGLGDMRREYAEAVDTTRYSVNVPLPGFEVLPLAGQSVTAPGTPATGEAEAIRNAYGAARLDSYAADGSVRTVEGGLARVENEDFVTSIGRVQVLGATRPWARVAYAAERFHLMAWYSGRSSFRPAVALSSGLPVEDHSSVLHAEAQYNRPLRGGRGRIVVGGSWRQIFENTDGTLIVTADDDRSDHYGSLFGQVEYTPLPQLRLVGAARFDASNLIEDQFSPKAAAVFTPNRRHSLRFTVNRAFQTPSMLEFFLRVPAGVPADLSALEAALRASPLGPALAGVPDGELFTTSSAVPVLALGNRRLGVEQVTSWEIGYKAQLGERLFVTVDGYHSSLTNLATNLLPGVNPAYGSWTAPAAVPDTARAALEQAVVSGLATIDPAAAAGLTRLRDGTTAVVFSLANAGKAREYGVEAGASLQLTDAVRLEANWTHGEFEVDSTPTVTGNRVLPNTPANKMNAGAAYTGADGLDVRVGVRFVESYDWADGVFEGRIPSLQQVDVTASYRLTRHVRVTAAATNLFDQRRYEIYGGAVIGRRVLVGMTLSR